MSTAVALDRLLSAQEAERLLGIPAGTVRAWKARGQLHHWGLDEQHRPLYYESDLIACRDRLRTKDEWLAIHRRRQRTMRDKRRGGPS